VSALLLAILLGAAGPAPDDRTYTEQVRPFLAKHCLECHGTEKPKGDLRLDLLAPDFAVKAGRDRWLSVLEQLAAGAMPPKKKERPPEGEVKAVADWIRARADGAETARRAAEGRVVLRRLNRVEYEHTIRDLLGIEVDLQELLPMDSSAAGFDNVAEALHTSSFLMEKYLEAADKALGVAIANGRRPPVVKKRYSLKEERLVKTTTEKVYRLVDDAVVMFSSSAWNSIGRLLCRTPMISSTSPFSSSVQAVISRSAGKSPFATISE